MMSIRSFPERLESPVTGFSLLGCLHNLSTALWKSPARKYRRRTGYCLLPVQEFPANAGIQLGYAVGGGSGYMPLRNL